MRVSKLQLAKPSIVDFFQNSPVKVFRRNQLSDILSAQRRVWNLPVGLTLSGFLNFLLSEMELREVTLESENYDNEKRFVWGNPSPYSVALSLRNRSYLTHLSAMFLNELTDLTPKTIYVNFEQSPKPRGGNLTQEGIDRAFANRPRQSNLIFKYENFQMVVINGKFSGRLGVVTLPGAGRDLLDTTSLERTLIDIVVRPVYAGDAFRILEAFERAKDKMSINTLVSTLKKLDYVYPYHLAIGFLMERAGYPESKWSKLLKLGTAFDFYLSHQLPRKKKYDSKWRLFHPVGL